MVQKTTVATNKMSSIMIIDYCVFFLNCIKISNIAEETRKYLKSLGPIHFVKIRLSNFLGNEFLVKMYNL